MAETRTVSNVVLTCEDNLPLHRIASHGQRFTLRWSEKHPDGWQRHTRQAGPELRGAVGQSWHHPLLLQAMGFNPSDYSVAAGSPRDDA